VLEQKLHGTFARFTSFAHNSTPSCHRNAGREMENCAGVQASACFPMGKLKLELQRRKKIAHGFHCAMLRA
jgi:hypothetical protein